MANLKKSDREKYNPDGENEYSTPKEKPKRTDLRNKHRRAPDPLETKDVNKEKEMNRSSKKQIVRNIIAASKRDRTDAVHDQTRDGIENFKFKETGIKQVAKTYKHLAEAFNNMIKAGNIFSSCKSSEISPDGKLGGKGYIQPIKNVRMAMSECLNMMSELVDTFHDEVNSPYWKKTTLEDHPAVKEILSEADDLVDKAEDMEEKFNPKDPENLVLSEKEKEKVKHIIRKKWKV